MSAKRIMIQGTASSVGKSIIVTGLCRIFRQDGLKVAPFKSQNMALNSYITRDGKEMGRAQAVQAEAARIEPAVTMNPILLKPSSEMGTQVIVNGRVMGNWSVSGYQAYKPELVRLVREAYATLSAEYDCIVLEGAGSPAEINLKDLDFVNMGMAEIADAPVILVGDIDKGGVFASLAGTMLLLTESERSRVKGVIINKFRGDVELLKPGLDMLEGIIGVPVLGVLPYMDLDIEEEDSVTERLSRPGTKTAKGLDVAVIRLPYLSNFTDFNVLEKAEGVNLRYVERPDELGEPDLIVLPGSKNTVSDLLFLKTNGLEEEIKKRHVKGAFLFGICGGYQMLGRTILDPDRTESSLEKLDGFGLLDAVTEFRKEKVTRNTQAEILGDEGLLKGLAGILAGGYEIHMGETVLSGNSIPFLSPSDKWDPVPAAAGARNMVGTVYGTYLHGIFDNVEFTNGLVNNLRKAKGLEPLSGNSLSHAERKEMQYDCLAEQIRKHLDMEKIYEILNTREGHRKSL